MPGPISQAYEPAICSCQHFKDIHEPRNGRCNAPDCDCAQFDEIPLERSEFGQAFIEWVQSTREDE